MNRVVICYKWVPFDEDIKVNENTHALQYEDARYVVGSYDRNALEAAMQLCEKNDWSLSALSAAESSRLLSSKKDVLSRGPSDLTMIVDEKLANADSHVTANVLATAIEAMEDVGLVVCAEGSSDIYAQQTAPRLARRLGWPVITCVSEIAYCDGHVRATRKLEGGSEIIECPLPLVVSIADDSNTPRIPSFKQIMAAGKKPTQVLDCSALGLSGEALTPAMKTMCITGNVSDRKAMVLDGELADTVNELTRLLLRDGCLN